MTIDFIDDVTLLRPPFVDAIWSMIYRPSGVARVAESPTVPVTRVLDSSNSTVARVLASGNTSVARVLGNS